MLNGFYGLALFSIMSALGVICFRDPIRSALSLVSTFIGLGAIYVVLDAEFTAAIQILVYAGAIMVLFLFVLMLLKRTEEPEKIKARAWILKLVAGLATLVFLIQLVGVLVSKTVGFGPADLYSPAQIQQEGMVQLIGTLLYGKYLLPLELVSLLLLIAVMGAVVIAKRRDPNETSSHGSNKQ